MKHGINICVALLALSAWAPAAFAQTYSLADAMQAAVDRAPTREAARSSREASHAAKRVETSELWPKVIANGSARYVQPTAEIDLPLLPKPIQLGTDWMASAGLTAQWRAFDPSRWASISAASEREGSAAASVENVALEVERRVRDLYLTAAYFDDVIHAAETSSTAISGSLHELEAQLDAGLASEVDVAAARARVAQVQARLIDARTHQSSALAALRVMLGLAPDAPIELAQTVSDVAGIGAPEGASTHPRIAAARSSARSAELDAIAAARRWWPTIDVFATGEYRYPRTTVDDTAGFGWVAGAQISWLLFDGGLRFAATDAQKAKARALRSSAAAADEQLQIERADADARIASADASIEAAQAQLDAAEALANLMQVSFEAGTARATDLLDAQVQVDQARLAQVTANYQLALAKSALWRASGAIFSDRGSQR